MLSLCFNLALASAIDASALNIARQPCTRQGHIHPVIAHDARLGDVVQHGGHAFSHQSIAQASGMLLAAVFAPCRSAVRAKNTSEPGQKRFEGACRCRVRTSHAVECTHTPLANLTGQSLAQAV